jgi:hypothetical protein
LYALLLNLYPQDYLDEFREELKEVFELSLQDASQKGGVEVAAVLIHELLDLPKAIIYEHLRQKRKAGMIEKFSSSLDFAYGSWKEFLTALLPFFLVCVAMPVLGYLVRSGVLPTSSTSGTTILLALFGLFFLLFLFGLVKGLPRWSLPYLGFVFSLFSVYVFTVLPLGMIFFAFPSLYDRFLFFGDFFIDGAIWFGLLFAIILLNLLNRRVPAFHQFEQDWTLLSFVVYGAVPFALLLTFDEYTGDEPYTLLGFLVLAGGAWLYLHASGQWKRFGALFGALALAMFIAALGKLILVPSQDWPINIDPGLAKAEAKHTILMWLWLAVIMLVPLAIQFFPHSTDRSHASPTHGQEV